MGMSTSQKRWTAEEIDALPDDGLRYEIIDGERFVTPGPSSSHQQAVVRLLHLLLPTCDKLALYLSTAPEDVTFGKFDRVQPDLFVMSRRPSGGAEARASDAEARLLVVEVASPGSRHTDRVRKRELYQAHGVKEYWIVDTDTRVIERWRLAGAEAEVIRDVIEWRPVAERDAIRIDLGEYFRVVCDA